MKPEEYLQRLSEVSSKKLELLKDILELTRAQARAINEDGLETLSRLIQEKQVGIDAINRLDEEFEVYFKRLKGSLGVKSLDELNASGLAGAGELKDTITQIFGVMQKISDIENQNNENARNLLRKFGDEIKRINQGKKISNAYMSGPSETPSYFIDKKK